MADQTSATPKWRQICLQAAGPAGPDPLFNFNLILESGGIVAGIGEITQKLPSPNNKIVFKVQGTYQIIVSGADSEYIISLTGEYLMHCPPPELCLYWVPFSAIIRLNYKGNTFINGNGTFRYGKNQVAQEIVKPGDCVN